MKESISDESLQLRIDKFLELIEKANQLQKQLADTLIEALEIQKEVSLESDEVYVPLFKLTTSEGEVSFVKNPYILVQRSIFDTDNDFSLDPGSIDVLKNLGQIKISAWKVCPAAEFARSIIYDRICGKSSEECERCSGNDDGFNDNGYETNKIKLYLFGVI